MSKAILFLTPTLTLGGAERSLIKAATGLAQDGHRVGIVVLCRSTVEISGELSQPVAIFRLNARSTFSALLWWQVRQIVKAFTPDAVCGWSTYANFVAVVATRGLHVKVAVSERNFLPRVLDQPGVLAARRFLVRVGVRLLYPRADVITANSKQTLTFLRRYLGCRSEFVLLPNIVEIDRLTRLAQADPGVSDTRGQVVKILCVGRLDRQKGFDVLLRALAQIDALWGWRLLIVGDGVMRGRLEALARHLRFDPARIEFVGAKQNPFPYYLWADIVAVPSRFEGFPNVALEAMALGRAVVASRCRSGPAELTDNGRFGRLVRPENVTELANALLELCRDQGARSALGNSARIHVNQSYKWATVAGNYRKLLGSGRQ